MNWLKAIDLAEAVIEQTKAEPNDQELGKRIRRLCEEANNPKEDEEETNVLA